MSAKTILHYVYKPQCNNPVQKAIIMEQWQRRVETSVGTLFTIQFNSIKFTSIKKNFFLSSGVKVRTKCDRLVKEHFNHTTLIITVCC